MKIKINTQKEIDSKLEALWEKLEDILFDENSNGELILSEGWYLFPQGTSRDEIWHWFDQHHSKGIAWLLYEFDPNISKIKKNR